MREINDFVLNQGDQKSMAQAEKNFRLFQTYPSVRFKGGGLEF